MQMPLQFWETEKDGPWWQQNRNIPPAQLPAQGIASVFPPIVWAGVTNMSLVWTRAGGMIQYRIPIRNNTPQPLQYTFKDQNNVVIDLTNYQAVFVEIKQQGQASVTLAASFLGLRTSGQVQYAPSFTFTSIGIWTIQFHILDPAGNRVFGDILRITVVPNNEDLGTTQLPSY